MEERGDKTWTKPKRLYLGSLLDANGTTYYVQVLAPDEAYTVMKATKMNIQHQLPYPFSTVAIRHCINIAAMELLLSC